MTNFKNTINRGILSPVLLADNGKNFVKYRVFDEWLKDKYTGEFIPSGAKKTCKVYEGARGWEQVMKILAKGEDLMTVSGCIIQIPLINDKGENITLNRIILEEDDSNLELRFQLEIDYFREDGKLDEKTYNKMYKKSNKPASEHKGEDMTISQPNSSETQDVPVPEESETNPPV
jgi:hypothetical protein